MGLQYFNVMNFSICYCWDRFMKVLIKHRSSLSCKACSNILKNSRNRSIARRTQSKENIYKHLITDSQDEENEKQTTLDDVFAVYFHINLPSKFI